MLFVCMILCIGFLVVVKVPANTIMWHKQCQHGQKKIGHVLETCRVCSAVIHGGIGMNNVLNKSSTLDWKPILLLINKTTSLGPLKNSYMQELYPRMLPISSKITRNVLLSISSRRSTKLIILDVLSFPPSTALQS